ncbi:MAG: superoxide dismutase, Ni [candidate division Zixibacteria bacterium]|nr:superoxide dismutase, Ni [candidate division Zixibacteria bacterium]MBU1470829.1 superoxide dismutase, Ni [candidate division Zixibacteria bacterium]MBU2625751.1 superoxide dismutase, Ni [candidate division Zixibacteria bacterium]
MKAKLVLGIILALAATIVLSNQAWSHCEIPCGIYDDAMRYGMLSEYTTTIEKSMDQITALSAERDKNYNQIVRWVTNKEEHADKFQEVVSQYFLTQRFKPVSPDSGAAYEEYITQLKLMHEMLVYAMKCKQTTDKANTVKLGELVSKSRKLYFHE